MYIQISFPMVDLRPFVEEDTHRIGVPVWDYDQDAQGEFVRHFGHIRFANRFVQHLRETPFSKAKAALKLPHFNHYDFLNDGEDRGAIQSPYPHRRLFVHLRRKEDRPFSCEARFDFGVKIQPSRPRRFDIPDLIDAEENVHKLIRRFLHFPVAVGTIQGEDKYLESVVGNMGPSLANLYLYSSSRRSRRGEVKKYWVKSLLPVIILQVYSTREAAPAFLERIDPKKIIREFTTDQFHLLQFGYEAFGKTIPVWLSIRNDPSPEARRLEQQIAWNITQGHAEYQTAVYLTKQASANRLNFQPRSEASQRFQYFIDQLFTTLSPRENAPRADHVLFQAIAQDHYQSISVEECLQLLKNLSHIRKNILRKLGNFVLTKDAHDGAPVDRLVDEERSLPPTDIEPQYIELARPYVQQQNMQDLEDYIRYLVGQNKLEECLETLRAYLTLSNIRGEPLNTVMLHLQRYRSEYRAFEKGFTTREYYSTREAVLSEAILNFFREITA